MANWIEYGKTWKEFRQDKLNVSGTIIDVKSNNKDIKDQECLLGDMSIQGGQCDCCPGISRDSIVKRYKKIVI